MNDLKLFSYNESSVRVIEINGEPWWVAKDVVEVLGYTWDRNLIQNIPDEWKGVKPIHTPGGLQNLWFLSEQGLYFILGRADKPTALPFQKWIAGEVIPSIRKTGSYSVPQSDDEIIAIGYGKAMEKIKALEVENAELLPLANFTKAIINTKNGVLVRQFAKSLNPPAGERHFYQWLRDQGLIHKNSCEPIAEYIKMGIFEYLPREIEINKGANGTMVFYTTRITGKGQVYIEKRWREYVERVRDVYIRKSFKSGLHFFQATFPDDIAVRRELLKSIERGTKQ